MFVHVWISSFSRSVCLLVAVTIVNILFNRLRFLSFVGEYVFVYVSNSLIFFAFQICLFAGGHSHRKSFSLPDSEIVSFLGEYMFVRVWKICFICWWP